MTRLNNKHCCILSIVTVVKDDLEGLSLTGISLKEWLSEERRIEWVVQISDASKSIDEHVNLARRYGARTIRVSADKGIFSAMTIALENCLGRFVLFLNARDVVLEKFKIDEVTQNSLVEVYYKNFWGDYCEVPYRKSIAQGIPYCHQGMILEKAKIYFDERDLYGGDYSCFLRCRDSWPFPFLKEGKIHFDSSGISTNNRWVSDQYTANIIKREFGLLRCCLFMLKAGTRSVVKKVIASVKVPYK